MNVLVHGFEIRISRLDDKQIEGIKSLIGIPPEYLNDKEDDQFSPRVIEFKPYGIGRMARLYLGKRKSSITSGLPTFYSGATLEFKGAFFERYPEFTLYPLLDWLQKSDIKWTLIQLDVAFNDTDQVTTWRDWTRTFFNLTATETVDISAQQCVGSFFKGAKGSRRHPRFGSDEQGRPRIELGSTAPVAKKNKTNFGSIYQRPEGVRLELKIVDINDANALFRISTPEFFRMTALGILSRHLNIYTAESLLEVKKSKKGKTALILAPFWKKFLETPQAPISKASLKPDQDEELFETAQTRWYQNAAAALQNLLAREGLVGKSRDQIRTRLIHELTGRGIEEEVITDMICF